MNKNNFKYSKAIAELNDILQSLQAENTDIDEVSLKVKKAVELIRICRERIQKTEMEVKKIVEEFDGEFSSQEELA